MARFIHFDEARLAAARILRDWIANLENVEATLITDLFGKIRLLLRRSGGTDALDERLRLECGSWWTGERLQFDELDPTTRKMFEDAEQTARPDEDQPRLKMLDRHRSRTAWFSAFVDPPWQAPDDGPPIVVFYSFKGGQGRSTLLAGFAIQRAQAGDRVCVVDMDLDSPGAGQLLAADQAGLTASWGVVDFLLEHRLPDLQFGDYWHRCDRVSGSGEIRVMPSGQLNDLFPDKLSRVDLEEAPLARASGLWRLLDLTRKEFKPDWILLDARAGISEPAGQLMCGLAHLHVLLGSPQEQSWRGLDLILNRLGKDRILADRPQAEVLLVQSLVPAGVPGKWAKDVFAGRAESTFEDRYYADTDSDPNRFWTVNDKQGQDAPHTPLPVDYDPRLASFGDIADIADVLQSGPHAEIGARIAGRFVSENDA